MLRIAVVGANGQLGRAVVRKFQANGQALVIPLIRSEIDVTRREIVDRALSSLECDVVVNTSAAHGKDAETALEHTFAVNTLGPKYLADHCGRRSIDFVHISTDYVFRGDQRYPYRESDCCQPVKAYGCSKLAGEHLIRSATERWYIVRVSGLYGVGGCRAKGNSNFVDMVLERGQRDKQLAVVDDQWITPTYVVDVAETLLRLIQTRKYDIYHMTNSGACSWYEFACEVVRQARLDAQVNPIKTAASNAPFPRQAYSVLDNYNLRSIGVPDLRSWTAALAAYLEERRSLLG